MKREVLNLKGGVITKVVLGSLRSSVIELVFKNTKEEEVSLMIYCSWRLSQNNSILTGWNDDYDSNDTNYSRHLINLVGHTVKFIKVNKLHDIELALNDKILYIFSDLYNNRINSKTENWDLSIPMRNITYSALSDNELVKGKFF